MKTGLGFDSYVCNSLMDMYAELGQMDVMRKLFDEMPERDVVSWNVLISGYVKRRRFEDAIDVFCCMREESHLNPNEPTVVSTLSACAALKCLELGKEIHFYVRDRLELTSIIGSALLDMYCKCGCLSVAREIFDGMPHKNVICWTSMVSGYVNYGELDKARELFDRSPVRDVVLWTAMINGYVQFNHFDKAVALFQEMQIQRVKPDKFVLVALLTGCAQMGALEQGTWIHGYIDEKGIPVDAVLEHYGCLIDLLGRAGQLDQAEELIKKITNANNEIIVPLYGSLLSACRIYKNVQMGERVAEQLLKIESRDSSVHTLLANIYASAGRWVDVNTVRRKMKDLGVKKVPGCSSIEVNGIAHEFLVGDPSCPETREIYSMLDRMVKPLFNPEENEMEREETGAMNS
ncbi:REPEAT-CONTAINING PROTEIN putative-RELATED [Salix purpurea]|uniref:REPEAT-CONTAINING PROTEIN putative-RELATED n=1 Tax=Salix purpurea TaxID=77065 RepID=A0A9Q0T9Z9_SALPP|nr:REPEAT-CONTAINING PROTEIN putative-RELATED [Salix purpurea]